MPDIYIIDNKKDRLQFFPKCRSKNLYFNDAAMETFCKDLKLDQSPVPACPIIAFLHGSNEEASDSKWEGADSWPDKAQVISYVTLRVCLAGGRVCIFSGGTPDCNIKELCSLMEKNGYVKGHHFDVFGLHDIDKNHPDLKTKEIHETWRIDNIKCSRNKNKINPEKKMEEKKMEERSEYNLWHDLTHKNDERKLRMLEERGMQREVRIYEKYYKDNQKKAFKFAEKIMNKQVERHESDVPAHFALAAEKSATGLRRKAFKVLLVDDQEVWEKRLQRQIDAFNANNQDYIIELRYVSTAEEAHTAVSEIEGLQAVILDYYLEDSDFEETDDSGKTTLELAEYINKQRPELSVFGLTGQPAATVNFKWKVERVFYKEDDAEANEMLLAIIQFVKERSETPFFTGLMEYSGRPTAVFHALPLSRGKSVAGSQWCREFAEFYGEGYFAGETSSTMAPLGSVFSPKGNLLNAMEKAAKAFYADKSLFVTNGTTGANSIVYRALLKPGDLVILDRNCHKSHHYASVQSGAHVVYMEPEHINEYGISSLVSLETIENTVRLNKDAKMLTLTHPTFDGVCYNPETVIRKVHAINPEIIFMFDEAWFAYGVFHPDSRKWSAMAAAKRLREQGISARVYVTQSIHKTLSAMRQGSMIHIHEPEFSRELEMAMEEAYISQTTTSPNVHILASLDIARMQAEMEGFDRLKRAGNIADFIRKELQTEYIKALTFEDLKTEKLLENVEAGFDPLKVTLFFKGDSGVEFREDVLYKKFGIQINKYSHNTVLILVTTGTTWSMADYLVRSLVSWKPSNIKEDKKGIFIPPFSDFDKKYSGITENSCDIGKAYYAGMQPGASTGTKLEEAVGKTSAYFISPYPPGYPILVPGQIISEECVNYIQSLLDIGVGVGDIHGLGSNKEIYTLK